MRIALVDIQGFTIDGAFYPKELSIHIGRQRSNFLFKPPIPYVKLNNRNRKTVSYLEKTHHGILYDSGDIEYDQINNILEKYLLHSAEYIYVRGRQKIDFLQAKCEELQAYPAIYDVTRYDDSSGSSGIFQSTITHCPHHVNGKYMCTERNVDHLQQWLSFTVLPK